MEQSSIALTLNHDKVVPSPKSLDWIAISSSSLAPAVMGGQIVTRSWKGMSRKQREASP